MGVTIVPFYRAGIEGDLLIAGKVKISLSERCIVTELGRWKIERMDLHHFCVGKTVFAIARSDESLRRLLHTQPSSRSGGPMTAFTINREHVLQIGRLDRKHVQILNPIDPVAPECETVVFGAFVSAVEEVLLVDEAEMQVVLAPGIAGIDVAALVVLPSQGEVKTVDAGLVIPVERRTLVVDHTIIGPE